MSDCVQYGLAKTLGTPEHQIFLLKRKFTPLSTPFAWIWTNIVDIVEEDGSFFIQRFEVFVQNLFCLILKIDAFDNLSGIDLLHVNLMV